MNDERLQELAAEFGTPLYVFDGDALHSQVEQLENVFSSRVTLCFAMKANPFLLGMLDGRVPLFEVCSPGEYRICEACGIDPARVVLSGVYKDPAFIRELVAARTPIHAYTVESPEQFRLLRDCAREEGVRLPVLPRIACGSQFGIDPAALRTLIGRNKDFPELDIQGIQYFSGTQKTSLKRLKRELDYLDTYVGILREDCGFEPRFVEYGPGLPAEYFNANEEEVAAENRAHLQGFAELLDNMAYRGPLVLEIGRGIAATCGTYLTRVVDAKTNSGVNYAIVDGGMHHVVYYGHTMAMRQPVCTLLPGRSERDAADAEPAVWAVCGALCSTNDILLKQFEAADLRIGDILAFRKTGAYCMTEGISLFLSRDLPGVVAVRAGEKPRLLREGTPTFPLNMEQNRGRAGNR